MDAISGRSTRTDLANQRAYLDVTTRLPTFRTFKTLLATSLARCQERDQPLSLLAVSIDHLAQLAARHGPAGRDEALRETAAILKARLGDDDIIARTGPDEFLIALPGASAKQAVALAEALRAAVEQHTYRLPGDVRQSCTASVGLVTSQARAVSPQRLITQATSAGEQARQMANTVIQAPSPILTAPDGAGAPAGVGPGPAPVGRLVGAPILLWATVAGGLVGLVWSLLAVHWSGSWLLLVPFLALAAAAECLKVEVYQAKQERLSLSFTIAVTMAAVSVLPASAPLVSGLAALVHMILRRQRRLDKALFGIANPVLAAMAASTIYDLLRPVEPTLTVGHLAAALVAVASFYLVNIGLIVLMISLHTGRPLARVMRETAWFGPTNLALGLTGAFVGETHELLGLTGVVMFIVPLLVMRFTLALYARQSQQTIAALELARAEAEAAAHAREEFLSVASHELKTPLTTVKGYVQMLSRALHQPVVEREQIARYAGYLQAQVGRLEGLVADLLDSSRIQQGRLDLHPEPADLAALARHVLARFEHAAERLPTHRLTCDAPEPLPGTWDTTRLDQVLTNLVSNALKYSPNGGEVGVRVRKVGELAEVVVSDQGVGIPADARATLFRPFARGTATARNIPGAGLGLYIAARITERHGGTITVQSEVGVGSTFTVRLPLAPPA